MKCIVANCPNHDPQYMWMCELCLSLQDGTQVTFEVEEE